MQQRRVETPTCTVLVADGPPVVCAPPRASGCQVLHSGIGHRTLPQIKAPLAMSRALNLGAAHRATPTIDVQGGP